MKLLFVGMGGSHVLEFWILVVASFGLMEVTSVFVSLISNLALHSLISCCSKRGTLVLELAFFVFLNTDIISGYWSAQYKVIRDGPVPVAW